MFTWLRKSESGFTLVELMMVIVILGVLAGVAVPLMGNMRTAAWTQKLQTTADSVGTSIVLAMQVDGTFPTTQANVEELVSLPDAVAVEVGDSTTADPTTGNVLLIRYETNATTFTVEGWHDGTELVSARTYKWE